MSTKKKEPEEPSWSAASQELEQILRDIESGEIDLDLLSEKVERAAALLAACRRKLAATAAKIEKVTAELTAAMDEERGDDEAAT